MKTINIFRMLLVAAALLMGANNVKAAAVETQLWPTDGGTNTTPLSYEGLNVSALTSLDAGNILRIYFSSVGNQYTSQWSFEFDTNNNQQFAYYSGNGTSSLIDEQYIDIRVAADKLTYYQSGFIIKGQNATISKIVLYTPDSTPLEVGNHIVWQSENSSGITLNDSPGLAFSTNIFYRAKAGDKVRLYGTTTSNSTGWRFNFQCGGQSIHVSEWNNGGGLNYYSGTALYPNLSGENGYVEFTLDNTTLADFRKDMNAYLYGSDFYAKSIIIIVTNSDTPPAEKANVTLAFNNPTTVTTVGTNITNVATATSNGNTVNVTITYTSSDQSVATVSSTGEVTPLKAGTTTITASFGGNNEYNPATSVSYTLTVNAAPQYTYTDYTYDKEIFANLTSTSTIKVHCIRTSNEFWRINLLTGANQSPEFANWQGGTEGSTLYYDSNSHRSTLLDDNHFDLTCSGNTVSKLQQSGLKISVTGLTITGIEIDGYLYYFYNEDTFADLSSTSTIRVHCTRTSNEFWRINFLTGANQSPEFVSWQGGTDGSKLYYDSNSHRSTLLDDVEGGDAHFDLTCSTNTVSKLQQSGLLISATGLTIRSVEIISTAPTKQNVTLSFSPASAAATVGQDFTAPTLTATSNGEEVTLTGITYSSSNPNVARVNIYSGDVSIIAEGTTVITASLTDDETYNNASASYILTVSEAEPSPEDWIDLSDDEDLENYGFRTYVTHHAINFSQSVGVEGYCATEISGNTVVFTKVTGVCAINVPLLLKKATDSTEETTVECKLLKSTAAGIEPSVNKLVAGSVTNNVAEYVYGTGKYVLTVHSDEPVFAEVNINGAHVDADHAYLDLNGTNAARGRLAIRFINESTGISNIETETIGDDVIYNLRGQRVENPTKGLYIINGKKVVIK